MRRPLYTHYMTLVGITPANYISTPEKGVKSIPGNKYQAGEKFLVYGNVWELKCFLIRGPRKECRRVVLRSLTGKADIDLAIGRGVLGSDSFIPEKDLAKTIQAVSEEQLRRNLLENIKQEYQDKILALGLEGNGR